MSEIRTDQLTGSDFTAQGVSTFQAEAATLTALKTAIDNFINTPPTGFSYSLIKIDVGSRPDLVNTFKYFAFIFYYSQQLSLKITNFAVLPGSFAVPAIVPPPSE